MDGQNQPSHPYRVALLFLGRNLMNQLSAKELEVLKSLLARIENRKVIIHLLIEAVLNKYLGNKTHAAKALGYSLRVVRNHINLRQKKISEML